MKKHPCCLFFIFLVLLVSSCRTKEENTVKFISWGGKFQNDLVSKWIKPIADTLNIKLSSESWNGDYGILSNRIIKGLNTWDIIHVEDHFVNHPDADKMFVKFNLTMNENYPKELYNQYGIPLLQYGYILAYDSSVVSGTNANWKSFFNTSKFSGKRGLRDFPIGNIEIALLSLDRNIDNCLYNPQLTKNDIEIQLNDALKVFASIKKDIVWWNTGDQLQTGMESGEFAMVAAWSGRVWALSLDNKTSSKFKVNPNQALISTDWLIIPIGAKNVKSAEKLLLNLYNYPTLAKDFSFSQGYLVPSNNIKVDPNSIEVYLNYGSINNKEGISISNSFWSKNYSWISQQWNSWRLGSN